MADFGLGNNATGHLEGSQNWNSPTQVSYHYKLWVTVTGGAFHNGPGPTWSGGMGGNNASGNWTYPGSGTRNYTLREFDQTFNKDANGYITVGFSGSINGDNSPYVTSNGTSFNLSPSRIGVAPGIASVIADTIKPTTARLGGEISNYGLGTSATLQMFIRLQGAGGWTDLGAQGDVGGYNFWYPSGLKPGKVYEYFLRVWNNNGDTADSGVQSFTTQPISAMISIMKGVI